MSRQDSHRPLLIAHRTCPRHAAENSIAGIRLADEMGADLVEIDVRGTRERARVLMHDRCTWRTAGGPWIVSRTSVARVRALRLRSQTPAGPPPLLHEALAAVGTRMGVAVEVKDPRIVSGVLADIRDAGMTDRTLLWSYSERVVEWFLRHAGGIEVALLRDTRTRRQDFGFLDDAAGLGAGGLSIRWQAVDSALAARARTRGLSLYSMCNTARPDPGTAGLLTGLVTDWPAQARRALARGAPEAGAGVPAAR